MITMNKRTVHFKVRRFDNEVAEVDKMYKLEIEPDVMYEELKMKIMNMLNISTSSNKILKVRNCDGVLVPLMELLDTDTTENFSSSVEHYIEILNCRPILIDITKVHQDVPATTYESPLSSVYIDAVRLKLCNMESRIARVESVVPQLKWRRQSLVDHTAHSLGSRVAFLDRRIDELTPAEWNEKLQKSAT